MMLCLFLLSLDSQVPEFPKYTRVEEAPIREKNSWPSKARPAGERGSLVPVQIKIGLGRIPPKLESFLPFATTGAYSGVDPEEYVIELLPINPSLPDIRVKAHRPIVQSSEDPKPIPATWIIGELPPNLPQCQGFRAFGPSGAFLGQRLFDVGLELPAIQVELDEDGWMRITRPSGAFDHVEHRISLDDGATWISYAAPGGVFQEYFEGGLSALPKKPIMEILVIKDLRFERRRIRLDGFKKALMTAKGPQKVE